MRITVLGGTRFIGFALVEELVSAGHDVTVVHRGETEPADLPACAHVHLARDQLAGVPAVTGAEALIDMRAMTAQDAQAVLDVVATNTRLVVISSVDVYRAFGALLRGEETDPVPLDEDSPVRAERYPYRESGGREADYDKLDAEDLYLPRGATVVRLPMVYGERDAQRREEPILRRVRAGRTRIPIGTGTWLTTRGYVRDLARGIRLAAEAAPAGGLVLNLCEQELLGRRLGAPHPRSCRVGGRAGEGSRWARARRPRADRAALAAFRHQRGPGSRAARLAGFGSPRQPSPDCRVAPGPSTRGISRLQRGRRRPRRGLRQLIS